MPSLTKEQKDVVKQIYQNKDDHQVQTLGGFGGTGKTTVVRNLAELLPGYDICAFTGKAANILRRKGMEASTIHSLIYKPVVYGDKVEFELKLGDELNNSGFIVDEASMVSKDLYADLLSFDRPVIFVGDHGQLEPVGSNVNIMSNPMYRLETIHRNAGPIAHFAEHIRKGGSANSFESTDQVKIITTGDANDELLLEVDQCICAFNKFRVERNNQIRSALGYTKLVEVGEKVMCLKNNRRLLLFNGMQGFVKKLNPKAPRFDFESDGILHYDIFYDKNQFGKEKNEFAYELEGPNPFDYGYCITCHKCVHPDTLVETKEGLLPIKDIGPNGRINTINGVQDYCNFVHNPYSNALKIRDEYGGEIVVTPDHKVEVWDSDCFSIKLASELSEGDFVRSKLCGLDFRNFDINLDISKRYNAKYYDLPTLITKELAEFLGMFVADGTLIGNKGFRFVKRHKDVVDRFSKLAFEIFGIEGNRVRVKNCYGREFYSTYICEWLSCLGGLYPNNKGIPSIIAKSSFEIQSSFLKGLFEDGTASLKDSSIELHSCYPEILNYIKLMLARFGIHSKICHKYSRIYIHGMYCKIFKDKIGFISDFKNRRLLKLKNSDRYGKVPISSDFCKENREKLGIYRYQNAKSRGYVSRGTAKVLNMDLTHYYSRVKSIEKTFCESMCVEVPNGHMFYQNGYNFGNSQGDEWDKVLVFEQVCNKWDHKRWAYTAASRAKDTVYWAVQKRYVPTYLQKKGRKIPDWLK